MVTDWKSDEGVFAFVSLETMTEFKSKAKELHVGHICRMDRDVQMSNEKVDL